jgi:hypothetical protein
VLSPPSGGGVAWWIRWREWRRIVEGASVAMRIRWRETYVNVGE